jgi:hypothetical protein
MAIARSFRDLNVYREARETAQKIFELSREFPAEERYSLTDQIRRSSRPPATDYRAIPRVEEMESTCEQSSSIEEFFA